MHSQDPFLGDSSPGGVSLFQPHTWPLYRLGSAVILLGLVSLSVFSTSPGLIAVLVPVALGSVLILISSEKLTVRLEQWEQSFENRGQRATEKGTKFAKFFSRPLWAGSKAIWKRTGAISQRHFRAGLRLTLLVYYFGLMIGILLVVGYVASVVVIAIAVIVFMFWLLMKYLTRNDPPEPDAPPMQPTQIMRHRCNICNGDGTCRNDHHSTVQRFNLLLSNDPCPTCGGIPTKPANCSVCGGTGVQREP
jgi:hypothetical protein